MSGSRLCEGDPEELIECPFDPVHLLRRKRMPYHIIKCGKNFRQGDFRVCPFNSRHVVPKSELESHLHLCQDRGIVEREIIHNQKAGEKDSVPVQKGYTGIPISTFVPRESEESWDDSNVVVDIAPQGSLFLGGGRTLSEGRGATSAPPPQMKPPAGTARSRELPNPRVPIMSGGSGSEVFKLATTQVSKSPPATKSIGRGRGRGFLTSPSKVGTGPGMGVGPGVGTGPGMGAGPGIGRATNQLQGGASRGVGPVGLGRGRGVIFLVNEAGQSELKKQEELQQQQAALQRERLREEEEEEEERQEERRKQEKKLKKMLRQILELEEKQGNGQALNQDQVNKIARKGDVLSKLEQFHF